MKIIESQMLQIQEGKVIAEEEKDSNHPEDGKEGENLQSSEKDAIQKKPVPIEYFVINLMQLIKSKEQPIKESHREVSQMLNQLVETDTSIL